MFFFSACLSQLSECGSGVSAVSCVSSGSAWLFECLSGKGVSGAVLNCNACWVSHMRVWACAERSEGCVGVCRVG